MMISIHFENGFSVVSMHDLLHFKMWLTAVGT